MSVDRGMGAIEPGMPVFGVNGEPIGAVESREADGFRVRGHAVPSAAIARIDSTGIHLHLGRTAFETLAPLSQEATDSTQERGQQVAAQDERLVVPVVEERLVVGTRQMQMGEVTVEKRVVEEQIMVPVMVRREEIEIIRRAPGEARTEPNDPSIIEVIRIPLRGEEPVITTQAVVVREVVIGREVRSEERQVTGTVRSTELIVDEHLDGAYQRSRPDFEAHFATRQQTLGAAGDASYRARDFRDAEQHYRAGFAAGRDPRYADRSFEEAETEVLRSIDPAQSDPGLLDQLRDEVREGFSRARAAQSR